MRGKDVIDSCHPERRVCRDPPSPHRSADLGRVFRHSERCRRNRGRLSARSDRSSRAAGDRAGWRSTARGCRRGRGRRDACRHHVARRCDSRRAAASAPILRQRRRIGVPERSGPYPDDAYTRIDERLHFEPAGTSYRCLFQRQQPLQFYKVGEPNRRLLEFSVRWSGLWWVDANGRRVLCRRAGGYGRSVRRRAEMAIGPSGGTPIDLELPLRRMASS